MTSYPQKLRKLRPSKICTYTVVVYTHAHKGTVLEYYSAERNNQTIRLI